MAGFRENQAPIKKSYFPVDWSEAEELITIAKATQALSEKAENLNGHVAAIFSKRFPELAVAHKYGRLGEDHLSTSLARRPHEDTAGTSANAGKANHCADTEKWRHHELMSELQSQGKMMREISSHCNAMEKAMSVALNQLDVLQTSIVKNENMIAGIQNLMSREAAKTEVTLEAIIRGLIRIEVMTETKMDVNKTTK